MDILYTPYMYAAAEAEHDEILSEEFPQWSRAREQMVQLTKDGGFIRPFTNARKKRKVA